MKAIKFVINGEEQYIDPCDCKTKTFFLSSMSDLTTAQNAVNYFRAGNNPLIMYDNRCYTLFSYNNYVLEESQFHFLSPGVKGLYGKTQKTFRIYFTGSDEQSGNIISSIYQIEDIINDARTQTFYVRSGSGENYDAKQPLLWFQKRRDLDVLNYDNIYSPRIYTQDSLGEYHTYELNSVAEDTGNGGSLQFVSPIILEEAPNDYYVASFTINYSGTTVTSVTRHEWQISHFNS